MKYFTLLNLEKEPFSNSPDPDFLYLSRQHKECLHQLKLSLSMRRGLNVVVGPVGTGKTTLCRNLVKDLGNRANGMDHILHLFLESDFASSMEFLGVISQSIGIDPDGDKESEWELKEKIKHYLIDTCLQGKSTITLIFDEGQKLPSYCLEIMRELLNFETNNEKLIQIIIFAQEEFLSRLQEFPHFSDRVNNLIQLQPLGFQETRAMIRHRLQEAGVQGGEARATHLFSYLDILLIHFISKGYPRKIIMLCSKILIGLIVKNRKTAGPLLIFESAGKLPFGRSFLQGMGKIAGVFVTVVFFITAAFYIMNSTVPDNIANWTMINFSNIDAFLSPEQDLAATVPDNHVLERETIVIVPTEKTASSLLQITEEQNTEQANRENHPEEYQREQTILPGDYPLASMKLLTHPDIELLELDQLQLMRNEIYARHSYSFSSESMLEYFAAKSWYTPKNRDVSGLLSDVEKANILIIREQEMRLSQKLLSSR